MFPVIWLLDDDGHATGFTVRFCSEPCRVAYRAAGMLEQEWSGWFASAAEGIEDYCNDGEHCNHCAAPLSLPLKGGMS